MKYQNVKLIFPPQFEPFQPYLSLPYLKGFLVGNNIECDCFDANIDFYWWLFNDQRSCINTNTECNTYLVEYIDAAINVILRELDNTERYRWAINVIERYLSAISPNGVTISLTSLTIGNKYSSADLFDYINTDKNIFKKYFNYAKRNILSENDCITYLFSLAVIDQLGASLSIAQEIKANVPNAKIIFGGPFVSRSCNKLQKIEWLKDIVDIWAPGEAHNCLPEALGFRNVGNMHVTPDFSDFDLSRYLSPVQVIPYLISHGCKWGKCVFCTHHLSYSEYCSADLNMVVDDIAKLVREYNTKYISFCDEYLTPAQLKKLSDLFQKQSIDVRWSSFVKAEPIFCERNFTKSLYNAGARLLMFGFESASQRVLDIMNKGTKTSNYAAILKSCQESNIAVRLDFLIGFPGETNEEIKNTFSFIKDNSTAIDTPFSSYVAAVFELREDTPMMNELEKHKISIKTLLRGDLDEQYEYVCISGARLKAKRTWREKLIKYSKQVLNFEMITPNNKTHQLILKDLYDQNKVKINMVDITEGNCHELLAKLNQGVTYSTLNDDFFRLINYSSGGELEITSGLIELFQSFQKGIDLKAACLIGDSLGLDMRTYTKLVKFLYRNDYISIEPLHKNESLQYV